MRIKCVVGLDIGGTYCRIGLVDAEDNLYNPKVISTSQLQNGDNFAEELKAFTALFIEANREEFDIQAISIGFPSAIDKDRKVILSTPNIRGLNGIPIVSIYEKEFSMPVYINRDVNILMYYDLKYFKIPKDSIVLGFYIGTGLGNAIYINNAILLGKNGVAGELGHIPVLGNKKGCACGNESCIEAIAAGRYLEELCRERFPGTDIKDIYLKHSDDAEVLKQIEYMALPIATEINIFDPHYIIIGGGIPRMEGFPANKLEYYIHKHTRKPYPADGLKILYAKCEQESGIIGAGIYGLYMLNNQ
jgi:allose kinase